MGASSGTGDDLLEARDRIGGRCYTRDGIDLGAHWIHGTEGNPITNAARELGLTTLFVGGDSAYSGGWDHLVLYGPGGHVLSTQEKLRSILVADDVRDELDTERRRRLATGEPDVSIREVAHRAIMQRRLNDVDRRSVEWHIALSARDDCAADEPSLSTLTYPNMTVFIYSTMRSTRRQGRSSYDADHVARQGHGQMDKVTGPMVSSKTH
jgi:hypothetical protein